MPGVELARVYSEYGYVEALDLDEALELHLEERGITEKHIVSFSQRVFPKVIQAGANRRSMRWVIAMYTQDSVVSGSAS